MSLQVHYDTRPGHASPTLIRRKTLDPFELPTLEAEKVEQEKVPVEVSIPITTRHGICKPHVSFLKHVPFHPAASYAYLYGGSRVIVSALRT